MNSEQWSRIEEIFHDALLKTSAEREAFLTAACGIDTNLREEVQSLISAYESTGDFLGQDQLTAGLRLYAERNAATLAGEHIGHYELQSCIGSGGMGEVYLARDTRLGRHVALKVLPTSMGNDSEWIARFRQEARAASSISHPNIAHIYEVGEFEGREYIAMEHIDGITLRQRLRLGVIDFKEAIEITLQAARGLAAAHAAGVLHRDVKPENIMIRFDGYVKVLDFGLAKIDLESRNVHGGSFVADINETEPGVIQGTTRYMSPEQARGIRSDARTDIWSLGVALYETLCGEPPFKGETASDVLADILKSDPPELTAEDSRLSPAIKSILRRALNKDRDGRYQSVNELLEDLQRLGAFRTDQNGTAHSWHNERLEWPSDKKRNEAALSSERGLGRFVGVRRAVSLMVVVLIVVGVAYFRFRPSFRFTQESAPTGKKFVKLKLTGKGSGSDLSPDGRYLAYNSQDESGIWTAWLQDLTDDTVIKLLPPNDKPYTGFVFTQDGKSLYFTGSIGSNMNEFLQAPLYKMLLSTREVKKVTIGVNSAITLSPDGKRMAFIRLNTTLKDAALILANEDGSGEQTLATAKWPTVFYFPNWSADGKLIALGQRSIDGEGYYANAIAVHVDSGEVETLTQQRWSQLVAVRWLADGSGILATATDRQGEPMQIWEISYPGGHARNVTDDTNEYAFYALGLSADSSKLVIVKSTTDSSMWVTDRNGSGSLHQISSNNSDGFNGLSWTADGKILYTSRAPDNWDLWEMDPTGTGKTTRLTINAGNNYYPSSSPDGRHIVFTSDRSGPFNVWQMDRDGGNPVRLTHGRFDDFPYFTPDGKWVIYRSTDGNNRRLWKVSTQGGEPVPVTDKYSYPPALSPDGKLIASFYSLGALRGLAIIPIEGGNPIKTFDVLPNYSDFDNPFSQVIHWTRDMKGILYGEQKNGVSNIWQQPLIDGPPQQLTHFTSDHIYFFDQSIDGKQFAFCRGEVEAETFLVTDFR